MQRKISSLVGLAALVCVIVVVAPGAAYGAALPPTMSATVDVNVLFVGFEEKQFFGHEEEPHDYAAIYSDVLDPVFLAHDNDTIIRGEYTLPDFEPVPADHRLGYRYNVAFASSSYERKLFDHLTRIGRPAPRTFFQALYNAQDGNAVEIPDNVLRIRGPAVEQWLLDHEQDVPGFDPGAFTIVLINWYGKPDFRFHVYDGDGRDPDTGAADIGGLAWGASHGRLWFYDFSAGPDITNWNVDDADFFVPRDGLQDDRFVPAWEWKDDPRPYVAADATLAAGLLGRYSVLLQATASPIYDPLTSAPAPGGRRVMRTNFFQGDPAHPRAEVYQQDYVDRRLADLQPYFAFRSTLAEQPLAGDDKLAFDIWRAAWEGIALAPGCWEEFGTPFLEFFCHVAGNEAELAPPGRPGDHVIPALLYSVTDAIALEHPHNPTGYADQGPDLKPSLVFFETTPAIRRRGYFGLEGVGPSNGLVHEIGHHAGLSHFHDGWDPEGHFHFNQTISKWLYSFDECRCPMGYLSTGEFGRFELDAADRTLAARYYAEAFKLLGALDARTAGRVEGDLGEALTAFQATDWRTAVLAARDAYDRAVAAAPASAARLAARERQRRADGPPPAGVVDPLPSDPPDDQLGGEVRRVPLPDSPELDRYLDYAGR